MSSFPKFFKHLPLGTRYQMLVVMSEESAPGVILEFQHEIYTEPETAEGQLRMFDYQPDTLLNVSTSILPPLVVLRNDPDWVEGGLKWESPMMKMFVTGAREGSTQSTPTTDAKTVDAELHAVEADAGSLVS